MQQAIREAREKPNKKPHLPETAGDVSKETIAMATPPKPPRAYTYTEETGSQPQHVAQETGSEPRHAAQETGSEPRDEPQKTESENETEEKIESAGTKGEDEANSSLQQNPFKLTFKKKESVPQAVVKPLPSTIGKFSLYVSIHSKLFSLEVQYGSFIIHSVLRPFSIAVVFPARAERTCFNFCYRCLI